MTTGRGSSRLTVEVGKSPRWRTWTRKTIPRGRTGRWIVHIYGADDRLLREVSFVVEPETAGT